MDYEAEQAMELEALEAIFPDALEEFEGNLPDDWTRHGKTFAIAIDPAAEVGAGGVLLVGVRLGRMTQCMLCSMYSWPHGNVDTECT